MAESYSQMLDRLIKKLPISEKKNIIKAWEEYAETLPEDGKEVIVERIEWLRKTFMKKKKKIKKGEKENA